MSVAYAAIDVRNPSTVPSFTGSVRFGPYTPYNKIPVAKLKVKKRVKQGKTVRLDASKSHDRGKNGKIVNYAFDLDGNGSMEVNNRKNAVLKRVLPVGVHHVAVRVTDNHGLRAYATRTVRVVKH